MQTPSTGSRAHSRSSTLLLTYYLQGFIDDGAWARLNHAFDALEPAADTREAFATYYCDALHEQGAAADVPKQKELESLLTVTYSA